VLINTALSVSVALPAAYAFSRVDLDVIEVLEYQFRRTAAGSFDGYESRTNSGSAQLRVPIRIM
jgi:hypothetical protein